MGVFLLILKIIGITLGIILGVALLLILIVLLTPFRYQIFASVHGKEINADIRVHFWFRAVQAKITFAKMRLLGVLRILFIKKTLVDKSFGKGDKKEEPKKEEAEAIEEITDEIFADDVDPDQISDTTKEDEERVDQLLADAEAAQEDLLNKEDEEEGTSEEAETGAIEIAEEAKTDTKDLEDRIDEIMDAIIKKYDLTAQKVEGIRKKIDKVLEFLNKDSTKNAITYLLKKVLRILKHLAPKKAKGYLELGLDSPATMGTITNYMAMAYPFIPKTFTFTPVFDTDELVLECEMDFKGRLILMVVVFIALPALFNRNVRAVLKDVKALKN